MTAPVPPSSFPRQRLRFGTMLLIVAGVCTALPAVTAVHKHATTAAGPVGWRADLAKWRAARAKNLSAPDGWLTLVALDWLKPGTNTIGLAAGSQIQLQGHAPEHLGAIAVDGAQLRLVAPPSGFPAHFMLDGQPAKEGPIHSDDDKPSVLADENLTFLVLHRGDRFALRIKDAESPARTGFRGLHWYAPDPAWNITAKWIPFTPPHTEKIPTIIGTTLDMPAPGLAEFTVPGAKGGKTIQIEPVLEDPSAKELFFILRDATSHSTTYGAARFLYAQFPDHGLDKPGSITLDFNRLQNPPCAYTPYATCPLPPYINRLAIAIPAGEERYSH